MRRLQYLMPAMLSLLIIGIGVATLAKGGSVTSTIMG
jgi:hypothetical protein